MAIKIYARIRFSETWAMEFRITNPENCPTIINEPETGN
jgi:hypothetical protein